MHCTVRSHVQRHPRMRIVCFELELAQWDVPAALYGWFARRGQQFGLDVLRQHLCTISTTAATASAGWVFDQQAECVDAIHGPV